MTDTDQTPRDRAAGVLGTAVALVCPYDDCDFHEWVKLEEWHG